MPASNPEKLAKAWATATPLREFTVKEAARECRETIPGWPPDWTPQDASRGSYLRSQQVKAKLNTVQAFTIWQLVSGRIVGLGRPSDSNAIEEISESFWDGAEFDWKAESARSRDGRTVSEIRITNEARAAPEGNRKGSNSATTKRKANKSKGHANRSRGMEHRKKVGGRPNTSDEIRLVFRKRCQTRPGFEDLSIKQIISELRAEIRGEDRRKDEEGGYHSSSMGKIIGQERARLRNQVRRNKPNKPS